VFNGRDDNECRKKRKERAPGEARKRREKIKTTHGGIKRQS
jgi:hypothetical protein